MSNFDVRPTSVPQTLGDHQRRIQILEALVPPSALPSVWAYIFRDGGASAQDVTSGDLIITTTSIQHNQVGISQGMAADIASTPSRLVCDQDGMYLVMASSRWATLSASNFGVSTGVEFVAFGGSPTGLVNPDVISARVPSQVMNQEVGARLFPMEVGDFLVQDCGQNLGSDVPAPLAALYAIRLGAL